VRAIITLTTDFGRRDPWVGVMKGVILAVTRDVDLVDLTHEIAPHDVLEGALSLEAAVPFFPAGTVHLAVVDPGVGGARRALVVARDEQRFVGPDNGLFTPFLLTAGWRAFELSASEFRLPVASRTFHGRDVFAPAAAHLALGIPPERFGVAVTDPVRLPWPASRAVADGVAGEVVHVDWFGNLVTSIGADLREGKRTLPLIAMLDRADPGERARVRAALEDGALSPPAIEEIRRLVLKHAGVEYALDRAHAYARAAKADLAPFPASEERETLALLAEFVVDRDR